VLNDIESDVIQPKRLLRLELSINGRILPELVLNEVLVAHSHPAATSRYFITVGEQREEQRSSGIWIGTPGGSTGSLRSAGAPVLKITETRFEFVVREACMRPGENWRLLQGVLDVDQSIEVTSQMRTGSLCVDGPHIEHHFGLGDRLSVKPSKTFLLSYIDENVNDIFL
jgi:NAD+ kinase